MARRSLSDIVLDAFTSIECMPCLPPAAQVLWLRLALDLARNLKTHRFGSAKPAWLWRRTGMSEAEVETWLPVLVEHKLLVVDDDGGLLCPALAAAPPPRSPSADNGRLGGRPRRGEDAKAARERRERERGQGHLPLPIAGGAAAKPTETQRWETPAAGTTTKPSTTSESGTGLSAEARGLGREVVAAMGLRGDISRKPLQALLDAGHSAARILEVARDIADRPGFDPGRISSLNYLVKAMERVPLEARAAASGGEAIAITDEAVERYAEASQAWALNGVGPKPRREDFLLRGAA